MTRLLIQPLFGIAPVLALLASLIYLDSYKLVRFRAVVGAIAAGAAVAAASYAVNMALLDRLPLGAVGYSRYVAPAVEELLKAAIILWLMRGNKIGFLVDAAIFGFAIGAGFAVVENLYYMRALPDANLGVWVVRGFGTAVMHGGATAIFAILTRLFTEQRPARAALNLLPGLLMAYLIHSLFNHFFFGPVLSSIAFLLALPPVFVVVFTRSEQALQDWLGVGFDADAELLELIHSGGLSDSKIGRYLHTLKQRFRGEIVADLLCYLRLHLELSMRAKGELMMREAGFKSPHEAEIAAKFQELGYLEKSIGKTGKLALLPVLQVSDKDLWQLYMLKK